MAETVDRAVKQLRFYGLGDRGRAMPGQALYLKSCRHLVHRAHAAGGTEKVQKVEEQQ